MKQILIDIYKRLYARFGPQGWWPARTPLEIVVGAILTQNTAWSNVEKAISNLKAARLLSSSASLEHISSRTLSRLIRPAGYYNLKSSRLKNFFRFLRTQSNGDLKALRRLRAVSLRRKLLSVNGIGPETADSIMLYALGKPVFVVDAYTKRILSRHGLLCERAGYDDVQRIFEKNLPTDRRLFNEYHALIVRLGKERCRKVPRCGGCPLNGLKILAKKRAG